MRGCNALTTISTVSGFGLLVGAVTAGGPVDAKTLTLQPGADALIASNND